MSLMVIRDFRGKNLKDLVSGIRLSVPGSRFKPALVQSALQSGPGVQS